MTSEMVPSEWQPAFPGQRPPFDEGNRLSLKHGGYSARTVSPRAHEILTEVTADAPPWLAAVDGAALEAWSEAEARCAILREYVAQHGMLNDKGKPTNAADLLLRSERLAADLRGRLGFDPLSRARLGRDTALAAAVADSAVDRAAATGRAIREARQAAVEASTDLGGGR